MKYKNVDITIYDDVESKEHVESDFNVLLANDIDMLIKKKFIPWLLVDELKDKDPDKVFDGLNLYEINYHYSRIIAKYSPTNEDNFFGQFEFCFESSDDYTSDVLEACAMEVYVLDGKVVDVNMYDI